LETDRRWCRIGSCGEPGKERSSERFLDLVAGSARESVNGLLAAECHARDGQTPGDRGCWWSSWYDGARSR
jgi:hypothetical protein